MKQFKIRASACGQIMTNDRSGKNMGKTVQTYCETWLKEQLYNRRKEFSNKYTQKGLIVEDNSLDFVADQLKLGMLIKNEQFFENDFMTGTPDAILKDLIIDVKNSWSWDTFPLFESEIPNKDYYYQAQCYMELTGKKRFKLIYVLSDTPDNLIVQAVRSYVYQNGLDEIDVDLYDLFVAKMTYSDVPDTLKIKVYEIEYDELIIEAIRKRVEDCRLYISELLIKIGA